MVHGQYQFFESVIGRLQDRTAWLRGMVEESSSWYGRQKSEKDVGVVIHACKLILQNLRQKDCCELEANLGYKVSLSQA